MKKHTKILILIYDVPYKTPFGAKPLCIIFDKVDGYIRKDEGTTCLTLYHSDEKYQINFDRIRYHIMLKSNISEVYLHKYTKTKIN